MLLESQDEIETIDELFDIDSRVILAASGKDLLYFHKK
jgi:hypothetical protein